MTANFKVHHDGRFDSLISSSPVTLGRITTLNEPPPTDGVIAYNAIDSNLYYTAGGEWVNVGATSAIQTDASLRGDGSTLDPLGVDLLIKNNNVDQGRIQNFNFENMDSVTIVGNTVTIKGYTVSPGNTVIVTQNPGSGQYSSIRAAVLSIPTLGPYQPTDANRYAVLVYAGEYQETATIDIPSWVYITGIDMGACKVVGGAFHLFNFSENSGVAFLTIYDVEDPYNALRMDDTGDFTLTHKLDIYDCPNAVYCSASTKDSQVYLEYTSTNNTQNHSIHTETDNGFIIQLSIENYFIAGHANIGVHLTGNSLLLAQSCVFQSDGTGICVQVEDESDCTIRSCWMQDWEKGVYVPPALLASNVLLSGILFTDCVWNIYIDDANTTGNFSGYSEYTKNYIINGSPFFITSQDVQIVTVAQKGGNFNSVKAANDYITDASASKVYVVYVGPGIYTEDPIVMKPYVSIIGFIRTSCTLQGSGVAVGDNLITLASNSTVRGLTLTTSTTVNSNIFYFPGGAGIYRIVDCTYGNADKHIYLNTSSIGSLGIIQGSIILNAASFRKHLYATDNGTLQTSVLYDGLIWSPTINPVLTTQLFHLFSNKASAPQSMGFVFNNLYANRIANVSGVGVQLEGLMRGSIQNSIIGGFTTGLLIPNTTVLAPILNFMSSVLINNASTSTGDINIANPATTGTINTVAEISKVTIDPSSSIGVNINDTQGSIAISGQLYQGSTWPAITNITEQVQQSSTTGVYGHKELTRLGGTVIQVEAGTGYVMHNGNMKYVEWSIQSTTLPATGLSWLYIDHIGVLGNTMSYPNPIANIIIASAYTNGGTVIYTQDTIKRADNTASQLDEAFRQGIGPFFGSGCIVSAGSGGGLKLQVSSGSYWFSRINFTPTAQDNISMLSFYNNTYDGPITSVPLTYDNSGVLTAIPPGQWAKHTLYICGDNTEQVYLFVYAQATYGAQAAAETAALPLPPTTFIGNVVSICGIVVTNGDTGPLSADRLRDIRPTIGSASNAVSSTADHNSLLNLTVGNAHPQYLRVDGTSPMLGDLDMNSNDIVNAGTINSVTIEAHASRHLPNGADPLTTATPVTIGTSNSLGAANSFARSDHIHAHGAQTDPTLHAVATTLENGFMSSSDKTKLDGGTSSNVANTLVLRNGSGQFDISTIRFQDSLDLTRFMTITPAASLASSVTVTIPGTTDTLVNLNSAQVLTNKTLVLPVISQISNTGTLTLPTITDTLIGKITTDTLLNKSLSDSSTYFIDNLDNTKKVQFQVSSISTGTTRTWTFPDADSTFVGTGITQTLTDKTLILPVISQISNTGTLTLPTITDTLVGRTTSDTFTNKTLTSPTNNITANSVFSNGGLNTVNVSASANPVAGYALVADNPTTASWQPISVTIVSGILPVANGGTGVSSLASGNFLVGNGTGNVLTNKAVPTGVVIGSTDSQTISNKSLVDSSTFIVGNVDNTKRLLISVSNISTSTTRTLTVPDASTTIVGTDVAQTLTNKTLTLPIISQISNTGTLTLPTITDTLVGRTTTDTLSNKTLILPVISQISNTGTLTLPSITDTLVARTTTDTLTNKTLVLPVISQISNTGTLTLPTSTDTLVGRDTTDTFTNKTITSPTNNVTASSLFAGNGSTTISISAATAPTAGQVITALNGTSANWQTISVTTVSGTLPVSNGGTGVTTITSNGVMIGNGTSAISSSKQAPTGTFVGDTDIQTLTNKTLTLPTISSILNGAATLTLPVTTDTLVGRNTTDTFTNKTLVSPTNNLVARGLWSGSNTNIVDISAASNPTVGQIITAVNGTTATWQTPSVANVTGTLSVANGGTGANTLTTGNFLIGAGTSVVNTTKVAPTGVVIGSTDSQTMTNKGLDDGTTRFFNSTDTTKSFRFNVAPVSTGSQILLAVPATSTTLVGTNSVQSIDNKTILDNTNVFAYFVDPTARARFNCSAVPTASIIDITFPSVSTTMVGTTATQTLTNKTLTLPIISQISNTGTLTLPTITDTLVGRATTDTFTNKTITDPTNTVRATRLGTTGADVVISGAAAPTAGQVLTALTPTTANWQTPASVSSAMDAVIISEVQLSGTGGNAGAAFTNGAYRTRVLNTASTSPTFSSFATLAANQITIVTAGTYYFDISAPAFNVNLHKSRLQNITAGTTLLLGTSEIANANSTQSRSFIQGYVTLTAGIVIEVQHRCSTTRTPGFGTPSSFGDNETYTICRITKLS